MSTSARISKPTRRGPMVSATAWVRASTSANSLLTGAHHPGRGGRTGRRAAWRTVPVTGSEHVEDQLLRGGRDNVVHGPGEWRVKTPASSSRQQIRASGVEHRVPVQGGQQTVLERDRQVTWRTEQVTLVTGCGPAACLVLATWRRPSGRNAAPGAGRSPHRPGVHQPVLGGRLHCEARDRPNSHQDARKRSASSAAEHPDPAAVMACR